MRCVGEHCASPSLQGKKDKLGGKGGKGAAPVQEEPAVEGSEDPRHFPTRGGDLKRRRAMAALWQLQRALGWALLDGGHDRALVGDILREAASLHVHMEDGARAAHAMALVARSDAMAFRAVAGAVPPVTGSLGLRWARELVHGREAFFLDQPGRFK